MSPPSLSKNYGGLYWPELEKKHGGLRGIGPAPFVAIKSLLKGNENTKTPILMGLDS